MRRFSTGGSLGATIIARTGDIVFPVNVGIELVLK